MFNNFTVGLALVAGAANASYGHGSYAPQYHSYVQAPQHNSNNHGYNPTGYYAQAPVSQKFNHPNPWGADKQNSVVDKSDWWSPYQQFRPAIISYKAENDVACYARCDYDMDVVKNGQRDEEVFMQFAQLPGQPIQVQGQISAGGNPIDEEVFTFKIGETGLVGTECEAAIAAEEFNPMEAKDKYGNPFTFQDPSKGKLETITASDPNTTGVDNFRQEHLHQNLTGKDSLIGRSVTILKEDSNGDPQPIGCCVIVVDAAPELPDHGHHTYQPVYQGHHY